MLEVSSVSSSVVGSRSPSPSARHTSTMGKSRSIVREVEGDLFRASRHISLAHCVSSDMKMSAGIAVHFRQKFGNVTELLKQNKSVGQVAYLKDGPRFIFYLVTKKWFYEKPTERTLHQSLLEMKDKCKKLGVTSLAMPRIGCGLDGLKWPSVFRLIQEVFSDCGMEVTIHTISECKFKTMPPNLSKAQERFRNFFDHTKTQSLPASAMTSKRKHYSDSSEQEFETPKKRKVSKSNSDKKSPITGVEIDFQSSSKGTSNASKIYVNGPSSFHDHSARRDYDNTESAPWNCALPPQHNSRKGIKFSVRKPHTVKASNIPFLSDQDENGSSKIKNLDSEIHSKPVKSGTPTVRKSKFSLDCKKSSLSKKEKRKPASSDSEEDPIQRKAVKKSSNSKSKLEGTCRTPFPNIKTAESVVSKQFPLFKKKFHSSSTSDEDDDSSDTNSSKEVSSDEENTMKRKTICNSKIKTKSTSSQHISRKCRPSSKHFRSDVRTSVDLKRVIKNSNVSEKRGLSDGLKRRLSEPVLKAGGSVSKKVKDLEYPYPNIGKGTRKLSKSPSGTLYSDRNSNHTSVKARLSLGRKLHD